MNSPTIDLWDVGLELFNTDPDGFEVTFIAGDIRDPKFLEAVAPAPKNTSVAPPAIALKDIKQERGGDLDSLNPLRGRVSVILADLFFHQFTKEEQEPLARSLAGLLSPEPGSMIFGSHGGLPEEGFWSPTGTQLKLYNHSLESWKRLWEDVFGEGEVEVKATLKEYEESPEFFGTFKGNTNPLYELEWSVTRL